MIEKIIRSICGNEMNIKKEEEIIKEDDNEEEIVDFIAVPEEKPTITDYNQACDEIDQYFTKKNEDYDEKNL